MRRTFLPLGLLLFAATTLAGEPGEGEPVALEIVDHKDRLGSRAEAALRRAHAEFTAQVGAERVRLERVTVRGMSPVKWWAHFPRRAYLHSDVKARYGLMRRWLCSDLDWQEGHSEARPDLFPKGAARSPSSEVHRESFEYACAHALPPPSYPWRDEIVAACGAEHEGEVQSYLLDEVFTRDRPGRVDGVLHAREGSWMRMGLEGEALRNQPVAVGQNFLVHLGTWDDDWAVERIVAIDPVAGTTSVVVGFEGPETQQITLVPGDQRGLVIRWQAGAAEAYDYDPISGSVERLNLDMDPGWLPIVISGSALLLRSRDAPALTAILDLETGASRPLVPPDSSDGSVARIYSAIPAPDGFVTLARFVDQGPPDDYRSAPGARNDLCLLHLDRATGSWSELACDIPLSPLGVLEQRYVVGALGLNRQRLLAAYDLDEDRLLVSRDVCLDSRFLHAAFAGQAWWYEHQPGALVLGGHTLEPE